jgi:hypothetical protein
MDTEREDEDQEPEPQGSESEQEDIEVDLADINVGEEVSDEAADAFDEIEMPDEPSDQPAAPAGFDSTDDAGGDDEWGEGDGQPEGESIAEAIIEGSSRLAVIGLEEEFQVNGETKTKEDLREEFSEVFEAFRLGDFGSQVAEEYLFTDEEVDPLMGFAAACMCCTAMVLWLRPDGDDLAKDAYNRVASLGTGDLL